MTLQIRTARINYGGPDRLDVTRKSGGPKGLPFAPSWGILSPVLTKLATGKLTDEDWRFYSEQYTAQMRASYRANPNPWGTLLARDRVVLVCYCTDAERCHRRVLAGILAKLGAIDEGEIERAQATLGFDDAAHAARKA